MLSDERQVVVRAADKNDPVGIFSVLTRCADEIPVRMDGADREILLRKRIRPGCFSGRSYVAISDHVVVGFILATPSSPSDWYELDYGAILPEFRGLGLFPKMLHKIRSEVAGLYATVAAGNKGAMADRLLRAGFIETPSDAQFPNQRAFRWMRASDEGAP
jgi:hypothetical protein